MTLRLPYLCLTLAVASSTAFADVRDHRDNNDPQPEARDHRSDGNVEVVEYHHWGPRYMLPLKIDFGFAGANTSMGYAPGIGLAVGIHWASLSPHPVDTDVGLGLFGALLSTPIDPASNTSSGVAYGGAYLEVGHALARNDFARLWASGRGEYLGSSAFDKDHKGFGVMGRLSGELYTAGAGVAPRGVFLGSYAIGLYVEAGARDMVQDVGKFSVGAGLTFRTPLALLW
ncbi:MAG: hypothetical protein ABJE66_17895 [Deltaproteobacteria bacterium]